jgi:ring-1,2-phenylacetyl-CoA epoxidase subunit PaaC
VTSDEKLLAYVLRLGDNALITGQRMIERVASEPELEEELANANLALDYIGQARLFYSYAGDLEGKGRTEDDFAYLRDSHEFQNFLLTEQPNGHFGESIVRQVLFDTFYLLQLEALAACGDQRLAEIAARAEKEIRYHLRYSSQWLVRLGDGTEESHARAQTALDELWCFTGEFFLGDEIDAYMKDAFGGPDLEHVAEEWRKQVKTILDEATLSAFDDAYMAAGGRDGKHSEHMGYLIGEMQQLQRVYPGATW